MSASPDTRQPSQGRAYEILVVSSRELSAYEILVLLSWQLGVVSSEL